MILLSAHKDTVFNNYRLEYKNGVFTGLLDNYIGCLVVNGLLMEEPAIALFEKQKVISVHFGDSEEWGTITKMPELKQKDLVIVVDVCSGKQYDNFDISLENIYGVSKKDVNHLKEKLEWEGFKIKIKMYNGEPDDEDEAFYWVEKKQPVISFIIPIKNGSKTTGWHNEECTITIENVVKAKQILKRTLNYLI